MDGFYTPDFARKSNDNSLTVSNCMILVANQQQFVNYQMSTFENGKCAFLETLGCKFSTETILYR